MKFYLLLNKNVSVCSFGPNPIQLSNNGGATIGPKIREQLSPYLEEICDCFPAQDAMHAPLA